VWSQVLTNDRHKYTSTKPIWTSTKQQMMGWQWHQLDHMQINCTSLQTDNHASTPSLNFFTGQMLFLSPNQPTQSTNSIKALKALSAKYGTDDAFIFTAVRRIEGKNKLCDSCTSW